MKIALVSVLLAGACTTAAFAQTEMIERGKQVFEHWCAPCHGSGRGVSWVSTNRSGRVGAKPRACSDTPLREASNRSHPYDPNSPL